MKRHAERFYTGVRWTEHVRSTAGYPGIDPFDVEVPDAGPVAVEPEVEVPPSTWLPPGARPMALPRPPRRAGLVAVLVIAAVIGAAALISHLASSSSDAPYVPIHSIAGQRDPTVAPSPRGMTLAKFQQIQTGMSYAQVVEIVGTPGRLEVDSSVAGITGQIYAWDGAGSLGANATVQLQNGRVVVKAQFGLG